MFTTEQENKLNISTILEDLLETHKSEKILFRDLMQSLHERGFGFITIIFVLPNCIPLPSPPGWSTLFAVPLVFVSIQMMLGRDTPWIPKWLGNKVIKKSSLKFMVDSFLPRLRWIEKFLKPRLFILTASLQAEKFLGLLYFLLSIIMALPIPLMNFLPGITILVMSIGLITKDGIIILLGLLMSVVVFCLLTAMLMFGHHVVMNVLDKCFEGGTVKASKYIDIICKLFF